MGFKINFHVVSKLIKFKWYPANNYRYDSNTDTLCVTYVNWQLQIAENEQLRECNNSSFYS